MTENEIIWCTAYDTLYNVRFANPDTTSTPHWHATFELYFFTEGSGTHVINGKSIPFTTGSIFLISPNDIHNVDIDEGVYTTALKVNVSNAFYYYYFNPNCHFEKFPVSANLLGAEFEKAEVLTAMLLECREMDDSPAKDELCLNILEQFFILIMRNSKQPAPEDTNDKLKDALSFIHKNFHNQIKVADIAKEVSYSSNYLSSQFSKKFGISIRDYLQDLRLFYAKDLIRYSNFTISEICYRSGFQSVAYFSKVFKNRFLQSPNSFRNINTLVNAVRDKV